MDRRSISDETRRTLAAPRDRITSPRVKPIGGGGAGRPAGWQSALPDTGDDVLEGRPRDARRGRRDHPLFWGVSYEIDRLANLFLGAGLQLPRAGVLVATSQHSSQQ
jgi:hypothetical protein